MTSYPTATQIIPQAGPVTNTAAPPTTQQPVTQDLLVTKRLRALALTLTITALWVLLSFGCAQLPTNSIQEFIPRMQEQAAEQAVNGQAIQIVRHQNYILGYYEASEQPAWVLYELRADQLLAPRWKRSGNFRADPVVASGSASLSDYYKSGYDRGHLAPAADMAFSEKAMSESFYLSNISPQRPAFNRGIWRHLEELMRRWAIAYQRIIIVTAGVVTGPQAPPSQNLASIGENQVWVPHNYYKVVYDPERQLMIAFLLQNRAYQLQDDEKLSIFATTVDAVEELSALDFFPQLPDTIEESMESQADLSAWDFAD